MPSFHPTMPAVALSLEAEVITDSAEGASRRPQVDAEEEETRDTVPKPGLRSRGRTGRGQRIKLGAGDMQDVVATAARGQVACGRETHPGDSEGQEMTLVHDQ